MTLPGIIASGGLAPTAPTIGTATAGIGSATVSFTVPTWTGKGSGTVTYTATSSPGSITGTSTSSPITVSGLTNGTAYTFTVRATTSYGVTGPASSASNSVTPVQPPSYFVAVSSSTTAASSTDGVTWTSRTLPALANFVTYTNSKFYAQSSNAVSESTTGVSWSSATSNSQSNFRYAWGGNGYLIKIGFGGVYSYANAGSSWTSGTMPTGAGDWFTGTYGNSTFVAATLNNGSVPSTLAATATNPATWTQRTLASAGVWRASGFGNSRFIVVGDDTSYGASQVGQTSTDNGATWSNITLPSVQNWRGVAYGNGVFIVASTGTAAASSTNGTTWTSRTMPSASGWYSATYGNGTFVVAGDNGKIAYSTNGTSWSETTAVSSIYNWSGIAFNADGGQGA